MLHEPIGLDVATIARRRRTGRRIDQDRVRLPLHRHSVRWPSRSRWCGRDQDGRVHGLTGLRVADAGR
ncbi:hypothetical protein HBB16_03890 [Pseudonocardia sp. MCCB 268]|nr:hypothetical protein [Pseudonocardia cytotoxica]